MAPPVSGLEAAGAGDVAGGTDALVTHRMGQAIWVGVAAVIASVVINESAYYEVWAEASVTVGPAIRQVTLGLTRGTVTTLLELSRVKLDVNWQSRVYETWLSAGDLVRGLDGGGALGDVGEINVHVRLIGR